MIKVISSSIGSLVFLAEFLLIYILRSIYWKISTECEEENTFPYMS